VCETTNWFRKITQRSLNYFLNFATRLRSSGFKVIVYPEVEKLTKQLKFADRLSIKVALVTGPDEIARNEMVIKNLQSRE
jgi:histidyl-tRNA synthetase